MSQKIVEIPLKDLVLWTENPRDPVDPSAKDQDIVDRALNGSGKKWNIRTLAKKMGDHYDYSELPTVVYHGKKPVVYDGNQRIILGKIKHNLVDFNKSKVDFLPVFPEIIPCNVCSEKIALQNVFRKHGGIGSWNPLERDIFINKHLKGDKSPFLIIDECTGLITANPHLNKRFVKDEVFKKDNLNKLGFSINNDKLTSKHNNSDVYNILNAISKQVLARKISTRKNRGNVFETLDSDIRKLITSNKNKKFEFVDIINSEPIISNNKKITKRVKSAAKIFFGGKLYLKSGVVSNLYRDICDLYDFYDRNKSTLSPSFVGVINMSLRLLCETAAKDCNCSKIDRYAEMYFDKAKKELTQDDTTFLYKQNVSKSTLVSLLHTGAHSYSSSSNFDQVLAVSIVLGRMLTISHSKD